MAKGKNNNGGGGGGEKSKDTKNGGGELTIIFKVNFHCQGCIDRIRKIILSFPGVFTVKFEGNDKVTVIGHGNVAIEALRSKVKKKMNKKVELVSPLPKKDNNNNNNKNGSPKNDKPKEPPLTSVVLKVMWHCHGCGERIHKAVSSFKGVYEVEIDKDKDLVRVKGIMDAQKLAMELAEKMKRHVEIVPPKKEKEKEKGGRSNGGGSGGGGSGGGKDKAAEGGGAGGGGGKGGESILPYVAGSGYGYGYGYGYGFPGQVDPFRFDAPQFFSDENPNGCSIM